MEIGIKERVVGAAVLVVVAIIIVPILLQGRGDKNTVTKNVAVPTQNTHQRPVEYRMDLAKPAAGNNRASPTPPAENKVPGTAQTAVKAAADQAAANHSSGQPGTQAVSSKIPATSTQAEKSNSSAGADTAGKQSPQAGTGKAQSSPAPTVAVKSAAGSAITAAKDAWVVQVGSFSTAGRAQTVVQKLKNKGYKAYVLPYKTSTRVLYRVRVGPYADKPSANKAAPGISAAYGSKVKVMPAR